MTQVDGGDLTTASVEAGDPSESRTKAWNQALWIGSRAGGPIVLVILVVIFWATMPNTFGTKANFQSMVSAQAVPGILALGLLFPLVAGEFDFSDGAVASAAAVFLVVTSGTHHWSWPLASLVVIGGATAIGAINGFLVAYLSYSSFVTTLAVSGVIGGVALAQSNGLTLYKGIPQSFLHLGSKQALSVPLPAIYLVVVFVGVAFVLRQTAWGRYNEAAGKGRAAARLAGVNVRSHILVSFIVSAALASIAGLVLVARLGSAQPNGGSAFTLSAFAAALLGATMFRPGFFNAPGTVVAILLIAVGINGLTLAGVPSYIEQNTWRAGEKAWWPWRLSTTSTARSLACRWPCMPWVPTCSGHGSRPASRSLEWRAVWLAATSPSTHCTERTPS